MKYLGIDYGEKRIGLSYADELGVAVPLDAAVEKDPAERLATIGRVINGRKIDAIVIGYPYNMDGSKGGKIVEVDTFIKKLEVLFNLPVYRVDERLTSLQAEADEASILSRRKKKSVKAHQSARKSGVLDSRAATLILQDFLVTSSS